jgi:hypothetical protein
MNIFKDLPYELKVEVIKKFNIIDFLKIQKIYPNIILYLNKYDIKYISDNTNFLKYDILELNNELIINKNLSNFIDYSIIFNVIINSNYFKYEKIIRMPLPKYGYKEEEIRYILNDKIFIEAFCNLFLSICRKSDNRYHFKDYYNFCNYLEHSLKWMDIKPHWTKHFDLCMDALKYKINEVFKKNLN